MKEIKMINWLVRIDEIKHQSSIHVSILAVDEFKRDSIIISPILFKICNTGI